MTETMTVAVRVLETLISSGAVTADQVEALRFSGLNDAEAGRALVERQLVTEAQLTMMLEEELGYPRVDLESYAPDDEALEIVPGRIARERGFLPLFEIEGTLTVAIGDPLDIFSLDAIGVELGYSIDAVLADAPAVLLAIDHYYPAEMISEPVDMVALPADDLDISAGDFFELAEGPEVIEAPSAYAEELPADEADAAPVPASAEPLPADEGEIPPAPVADAGEPMADLAAEQPGPVAGAIDLDVLAVADERTVAVLVSDILEEAVTRGASRIHLLPYKTDFFLVFRVKGRLERIASAPLSMQQALITGFKNFAKLSSVASNRPALRRMHAEIGGKTVVLTVSVVPTVSGQRLVMGVAPVRPQPRGLSELGMPEAESRALHAMVERGRGLVLVAAPVTGGRSTTYYSLLQEAAVAGRTVYSVERSIDYEIPAVAQVLVNPGEAVGAAAYFAAGMQQDTDVMAIDSLQSVEELHLAIEAAGMGKLVIATFAGADIVSAVRRLLDMGAEPVSLASALTLGVGQRVLRTNCPNCSVEVSTPLVDLIPGVEPGTTARRGSGCPNCGKSGFSGVTGIFEVLPFTEPVRAAIARGGSASDIASAARAAGMRPMIASGVSLVRDGAVSPEELDRVLRFS